MEHNHSDGMAKKSLQLVAGDALLLVQHEAQLYGPLSEPIRPHTGVQAVDPFIDDDHDEH